MIQELQRISRCLHQVARNNCDTDIFERRQDERTGEAYYKRLSTGCIILAENKEQRTDELTGVTYYRDTSNNRRTFISSESKYEIFNFFANSPNPLKAALHHQLTLGGNMKDFGDFTAIFTGESVINGSPSPAGIQLQCNTTGEPIGFIPLHLDFEDIIAVFKKSYLERNKVEISDDVLDKVKDFIENLRVREGF